MAISASDLAGQQWDALIALFNSHVNVGTGGPGTGSNSTGKLQTVWYVHESADLWSENLPSLGVQLMSIDPGPSPYASQQNMVCTTFHIFAATKAVRNQATGLTVLDDAMARLRVLLDDGSGNGVLPILNLRANFTLGGLALRSRVGKVDLAWQYADQGESDPRAFARIEYKLWNVVEILN